MNAVRLTDENFNLVRRLTSETHLDSVINIFNDDKRDYFYDFEEDERLSLKEGFKILADCIAYSFQHEGFTDDESKKLESLIQQFLPGFQACDPAYD